MRHAQLGYGDIGDTSTPTTLAEKIAAGIFIIFFITCLIMGALT